MKKEKEMVIERNSKCWYKDVCTLDSCNNCIRYLEMKYLIDNSNIPPSRQIPNKLIPDKVDYDSFIKLQDIKDNIVSYVNAGNNLYITSKRLGNGKTSWSIKLLLKYFNEIWPGNGFRVRGLFIHVPTFLNQLKSFNSPLSAEYKSNIFNTDLVVWDDIASTKLSEYDHSQLLSYIDVRILNGKSNIYTGNMSRYEELEQTVGQRLASRIWYSDIVEFIGKDRRL